MFNYGIPVGLFVQWTGIEYTRSIFAECTSCDFDNL